MAIDKQESVKSKLFTAQSAKVDTNKGDAYYEKLYAQCRARLDELKELTPLNNRMDFKEIIEAEVLDRRDFLKWASACRISHTSWQRNKCWCVNSCFYQYSLYLSKSWKMDKESWESSTLCNCIRQ
jgi:hypothetical protein